MGQLFDMDLNRAVRDYNFPTFLNYIGIRQVCVRPDYATLTWEFDASVHANGMGLVHGGVLTTLLDVVMGYSSGYENEKVAPVVTTGMTIHFIAAAGNTLVVESKVTRQTKHLAFCSAEIKNTDGTIVAQAMGTFKKLAMSTQKKTTSSFVEETLS